MHLSKSWSKPQIDIANLVGIMLLLYKQDLAWGYLKPYQAIHPTINM